MNKEKQRIAIAKARGWKMHDHPDCIAKKEGWVSETWVMNPYGLLVFKHDMPDYLNDLNAMHEVEKMLTADQWYEYDRLMPMRDPQKIHATAAQKSEALLKALNLWEDE